MVLLRNLLLWLHLRLFAAFRPTKRTRTVENVSSRRGTGLQILPQKIAMPVPRIMIELGENLIPVFLVEIQCLEPVGSQM
jgi:hypothetical protein